MTSQYKTKALRYSYLFIRTKNIKHVYLLPKKSNGTGNGAETNCGIVRILGILINDEQLGLVDIFFSNYYNLQSVDYFELKIFSR